MEVKRYEVRVAVVENELERRKWDEDSIRVNYCSQKGLDEGQSELEDMLEERGHYTYRWIPISELFWTETMKTITASS